MSLQVAAATCRRDSKLRLALAACAQTVIARRVGLSGQGPGAGHGSSYPSFHRIGTQLNCSGRGSGWQPATARARAGLSSLPSRRAQRAQDRTWQDHYRRARGSCRHALPVWRLASSPPPACAAGDSATMTPPALSLERSRRSALPASAGARPVGLMRATASRTAHCSVCRLPLALPE